MRESLTNREREPQMLGLLEKTFLVLQPPLEELEKNREVRKGVKANVVLVGKAGTGNQPQGQVPLHRAGPPWYKELGGEGRGDLHPRALESRLAG